MKNFVGVTDTSVVEHYINVKHIVEVWQLTPDGKTRIRLTTNQVIETNYPFERLVKDMAKGQFWDTTDCGGSRGIICPVCGYAVPWDFTEPFPDFCPGCGKYLLSDE